MVEPTPIAEALKPKEQPKKVTILGSTGTIGQNTIKLIQESGSKYQVEALTARNNVKLLIEQAKKLHPSVVVIENKEHYPALEEALKGLGITIEAGTEAIIAAAELQTDIVIAGIVGAASLAPTLAAIRQGNTIGLANKECLVCAGDLMTAEVQKSNAQLIPVDSEHNAVYQCFDFDHPDNVEKITLTASGGPFRKYFKSAMASVTASEAIQHPNWSMGAKISVDSATMMNKGLEVIEAYHLFPVGKDQIEILVHPESIIHSLVSYKDGSVLAGLSTPDMCVPISYALGWPERLGNQTERLNLVQIGSLTFEAPDELKFPAIRLARQAMITGGTAPTILNAANEVAVQYFIDEKIGFLDITRMVEETLQRIEATALTSLEQVFEVDREARRAAEDVILASHTQ